LVLEDVLEVASEHEYGKELDGNHQEEEKYRVAPLVVFRLPGPPSEELVVHEQLEEVVDHPQNVANTYNLHVSLHIRDEAASKVFVECLLKQVSTDNNNGCNGGRRYDDNRNKDIELFQKYRQYLSSPEHRVHIQHCVQNFLKVVVQVRVHYEVSDLDPGYACLPHFAEHYAELRHTAEGDGGDGHVELQGYELAELSFGRCNEQRTEAV
jgi:hypothetical protein